MPLYKKKDLNPDFRSWWCGCMVNMYDIGPDHDLCDWAYFSPYQDEAEPAQAHMHPDMEEYWFVLEGKGKIIEGNKVYDVEAGDLVITPPLTPHKAEGNLRILCTMAKYNKHGRTYEGKIPMVCTDKPYRKNPEKQPEPWEYFEL